MNSGTLVVQKFGGTSLASPGRIRRVARYVTAEKKAGKDVIVVVSAMGDTTDNLFRLAKKVSPSPPKRELDMLLTAGERISMALLSMAISQMGYQAISFTGSQSGIVTDASHTRAKILDIRAFRVREELQKGRIVIVAGFQGVSPAKEVTTLGRGGSDTTCVALAATFNAQQCDIFTDVDGVYTADPKWVPEARKIQKVSYQEMLDLSFCGAEVLHWRSVDVALRFGVKVHVRSSFRKEMGTIVTGKEEIEAAEIRAITQDQRLVRIRVDELVEAAGLTDQVLQILEEAEVNTKFLCASPGPGGRRISIMIPEDQKDSAVGHLGDRLPGGSWHLDQDLATVSIIGYGVCSRPGLARRVLASLASLNIRPELVSTSGITMTLVVKRSEVIPAVRKLHLDLGLGQPTQNAGQQ